MKWKVYEIEVEGQGDFPLDMLRYDRCWPATGFDADKILSSLHHESPRKMRLRFMRQTGQARATADRWQSFGWTVTSVSEVR